MELGENYAPNLHHYEFPQKLYHYDHYYYYVQNLLIALNFTREFLQPFHFCNPKLQKYCLAYNYVYH